MNKISHTKVGAFSERDKRDKTFRTHVSDIQRAVDLIDA